MRWNFHVSPSRTIVWPALLPPWKRATTSARRASRSTIFPFPSSPHWAPTMTVPGMVELSVGSRRLRRPHVGAELPRVGSVQREDLAHLLQPGHRALVDLLGQLVALEVRRDDDRPLLLVARV